MITLLACDIAAGAVDTTAERMNTALWIFGVGLFALAIHAGLFIYRPRKGKQRSRRIFVIVLILSLFVIPIVLLWVALSGNACGFGANYGPIFLIIFEIVGLAAQVISWRFPDQPPIQSPIPLN